MTAAPTAPGAPPYRPAGAAFHDVVRGDNLLYPATPGWDFATGLGSPIASRLGDALVAHLVGGLAGAG